MTTSRIPGFYKMPLQERQTWLEQNTCLTNEELKAMATKSALPLRKIDQMIENAIGSYSLPYGLGLNFMVNGKDYLVPMAIEEPSVIASASHIAKIVRETDGFTASATERTMVGQIQVLGCANPHYACRVLLDQEQQLIEAANLASPGMKRRGGGAERIKVRVLHGEHECFDKDILIVHLLVNTCDAMGANTINTMVEAIAPLVEDLAGGKVNLRILSNYTDGCLASAQCVIPPILLKTGEFTGEDVRDRIISAYQFAASDIYRAVTHNKGVMNGIDAVVMATGNDWRAIEAGAHAYACRFGHYGSMTEWSVDDEGNLIGNLELPMPVGLAGGSIGINPMAQLSQKILQVKEAAELAQVIVSVGLAQNLGALKALATDGIQKGHMALQARSVAMAAGAEDYLVPLIANRLAEAGDFRIGKARELLKSLVSYE